MGRKAGQITIDLDSGTAKFLVNMNTANAKLTEFGRTGQQAGAHVASSMAAASASVRLLEGTLSVRAVERFLAQTLQLGPALQAAFPVVGALVFGGVVVETGKKVYEFFKSIQEAPAKMAQAFDALNIPLKTTNDELRVANDRIENDIAKLEGRHQNSLKLALDEAVVAADKLAEALDKDLANLNKLLKENALGGFKAFFTGEAPTTGDQQDIKNVSVRIAQIDREGLAAVRAATDAKSKDAAQAEWNRRALEALDAEIVKYQGLLKESQRLQGLRNPLRTQPGLGEPGAGTQGPIPDQSRIINERQGIVDNLQNLRDRYSLTTTNIVDTARKDALEASKQDMEKDEQTRKKGYDRMLAAMEQFETLMASEKLAFREEELRELEQEGNKYKKLRQELNVEIGRLSQESFKEAKEARDKDERDELRYLEELSRQRVEWQKRADDQIKKAYQNLAKENPLEPRSDIPQIPIAATLNDRLAGTDLQRRLKISTAGVSSLQEQKAAIDNEKELLKAMEQGGYTLGRQLEVRNKILQMQLALEASEHQAWTYQDEALKALVKEDLALGTLRDGWNAFFTELQERAKQPGEILYDGMNDALKQIGHSLSEDITGGKGKWGAAFKDVGRKMTEESVDSALHQGLGKLGKALGIGSVGARMDGQTPGTALYVQIAAVGGNPISLGTGIPTAPAKTSPGTISPDAKPASVDSSTIDIFKSLGQKLGPIFTGNSGGMVFNALPSPSVFPASGITSGTGVYAAALARASAPPVNNTYNFTFEGDSANDPLLIPKIKEAIAASSQAAVTTSVQSTVELQKRMPQ